MSRSSRYSSRAAPTLLDFISVRLIAGVATRSPRREEPFMMFQTARVTRGRDAEFRNLRTVMYKFILQLWNSIQTRYTNNTIVCITYVYNNCQFLQQARSDSLGSYSIQSTKIFYSKTNLREHSPRSISHSGNYTPIKRLLPGRSPVRHRRAPNSECPTESEPARKGTC